MLEEIRKERDYFVSELGGLSESSKEYLISLLPFEVGDLIMLFYVQGVVTQITVNSNPDLPPFYVRWRKVNRNGNLHKNECSALLSKDVKVFGKWLG